MFRVFILNELKKSTNIVIFCDILKEAIECRIFEWNLIFPFEGHETPSASGECFKGPVCSSIGAKLGSYREQLRKGEGVIRIGISRIDWNYKHGITEQQFFRNVTQNSVDIKYIVHTIRPAGHKDGLLWKFQSVDVFRICCTHFPGRQPFQKEGAHARTELDVSLQRHSEIFQKDGGRMRS
jgi:hypothetical protein